MVLVESLINIAGEDAQIYYENGRDGESDLTHINAQLKRIGSQRDEEICLIIT